MYATQAIEPDAPTAGLVDRANDLFDRVSPYRKDGFRNHCLRLFELGKMVMEHEGIEADTNALYAICMAHDLGILADGTQGRTYMHRSLDLFRQNFEDEELGGMASQDLEELMLFNHRVLPVPNVCDAAEALRKAVWVEHYRGFRTHGLDKAKVKEVFDRYPWLDFDFVLLDFFQRTVRHEPTTIVNGIFL